MKIRSKRIWIGGCFLPGILDVADEKVRKFLPYDACEVDEDFGNSRIVPGFIDIHTHGAYGFNVNSADPEGLMRWMRKLPSEGVTAFLATTLTAGRDETLDALINIASVRKSVGRRSLRGAKTEGAELLGVHMEGPYIDAAHRGVQSIDYIVKPDIDQFREYKIASNWAIRLVTVAPEHDDGAAFIRHCAENGIAVSIGHTSATMEQAGLAVANGAKSVTHTYNGMTGFGHRANGALGAALRFDSLYTEVICDGLHCTPEALNLLFRAKGKDKVVMISDSLMCKGASACDIFKFSGLEVVVYPDGSAHLASDGTFAGSTLRINDGLRILVEQAMVPFDAALNSCTANPASLLGLSDRIGSLSAGHDADIVVLGEDYSVLATYCKGVRQNIE